MKDVEQDRRTTDGHGGGVAARTCSGTSDLRAEAGAAGRGYFLHKDNKLADDSITLQTRLGFLTVLRDLCQEQLQLREAFPLPCKEALRVTNFCCIASSLRQLSQCYTYSPFQQK